MLEIQLVPSGPPTPSGSLAHKRFDLKGPPEIELTKIEANFSYQDDQNLEDELNINMSNNYFEDTPSMLTDGANCDFETNPADISYDGKMFDNNFVSSE